MTKNRSKSKDLYDRLFTFAIKCQKLVVKLPKTNYNSIYSSQLIRSSGSQGANYIEATEASSLKDFIYRLKVCRKESKESVHWLRLIQSANDGMNEVKHACKPLVGEGKEYVRIFSSSVNTAEKNRTRKEGNK